MKDATEPNLPGERYTKKGKEALSKLLDIKEDFRNREERTRADLEEARGIWEQLGKRFRWWQSLP